MIGWFIECAETCVSCGARVECLCSQTGSIAAQARLTHRTCEVCMISRVKSNFRKRKGTKSRVCNFCLMSYVVSFRAARLRARKERETT